MGISVYTAMVIQSRDDVECSSGGPTADGKYVGWITLGPDDRYRPLLNTEPTYDTGEDAKKAMEAIVADIRSKKIEELTDGTSVPDRSVGAGPPTVRSGVGDQGGIIP
jgi:hypothetical protein